MNKLLFLSLALTLITGSVYAKTADQSFIAIAIDKKSCPGGDANFVPLPDMDSAEANFEFINSTIDNEFGNNCKFIGLLLKGIISEQTLPQLQLGLQLLEARRHDTTRDMNTLWLSSHGGLIAEAMDIGNFIADKSINAIIPLDGQCYSACVLVYAAAEMRGHLGKIGIHRPFANEISANVISYSEYLNEYESITPALKRYFSKFGVSPAIVDAMNITPSDEIKILSDAELKSYGLGFSNVAAKEHNKAKIIQICGQEYYNFEIGFHALIESCNKQQATKHQHYWKKNESCFAQAHQAHPSYSDKFNECRYKINKSQIH